MESGLQDKLNSDPDTYSEAQLIHHFDAHLKLQEAAVVLQDYNISDGDDDDYDDEEEEEEEFSFMIGGENASQIAAEDAFINGQIKPVFPLFNRDLLFSGDDSDSLNLPMRPPVKVFVETNEESTSHTPPGDEEISGPYCEWSSRKAVEATAQKEVPKKSNSTGFSKIWRFKEFSGRCNSEGRDAFVFLNSAPAEEKREKDRTAVREKRKVKKGGRSKTASLSPHEVYLRSKAKEEERRRSYLPYRPELMGFFTNVNGGLTKNVHPY